jgi:hypothetical protein
MVRGLSLELGRSDAFQMKLAASSERMPLVMEGSMENNWSGSGQHQHRRQRVVQLLGNCVHSNSSNEMKVTLEQLLDGTEAEARNPSGAYSMREAKQFERASAPDIIQMVHYVGGGGGSTLAVSGSEAEAGVKADSLMQAKGQAQVYAQAEAQAHAQAEVHLRALAKDEQQTKKSMPPKTKAMSPKDKAAVQHLQLQAQYQHDLSLHMQKRVEDEVHAVLSTTQQPQEGRGGTNRQSNRVDTGKAGAEMRAQQPGGVQQQYTHQGFDAHQHVGAGFQQQLGLGNQGSDEDEPSPRADGRVAKVERGRGGRSPKKAADFGLEDTDGGDLSFEKGDGKGLPIEKLATRRDRNREHARKSRLRKKLLVVAQQQRMTELEQTNRILVEALQRYAPQGHLNSILAGDVQGGMAAAMTPMAEPALPRSQRSTGSSGARDSDDEDAGSTRMGMQGSRSSSTSSSPRNSGDGNSAAASKPMKVQVQAAHLQAELGILEALKRSLVQREQAVVQRERAVGNRAMLLTMSEKKLAVTKADLSEQQSNLVHAHQTKSDGADAGAGSGGPAGNEYVIGENIRGLSHWANEAYGDKAVDEMMQLMMSSNEDIPLDQIPPPSPGGNTAMDFTYESHSRT